MKPGVFRVSVAGMAVNISFFKCLYMITISEYGSQPQQCFTKPDYKMSLLVDYMFRSTLKKYSR